MTLADIGSLGEAISAIAVLVTLIYLSYQTRQNSTMLRQTAKAQTAQMVSANTDLGLQLLGNLMTNPGLAQIVERLKTGETLDPEDVPVANAFLDAWFLRLENLTVQRSLSGFDPRTVNQVISGQIDTFMVNAAFRSWWESRRTGNFSPEFSALMEKVISEQEI